MVTKSDIGRLGSRIKPVPLNELKVSGRVQRKLKQSRVDHLRAHFKLECMGVPVVNYRDGIYYIIDGQHGVIALRYLVGEDCATPIPCIVHRGLTEQQEAAMFDVLNNTLPLNAFERFQTRLIAECALQLTIKRIADDEGLLITQEQVPNAVSAVSTLERVCIRSDEATLRRTLQIVRDGFGDAGLTSVPIDGTGLLCQRYNGTLDKEEVVRVLRNVSSGVSGILNKAHVYKDQDGKSLAECFAKACLFYINAKRPKKQHIPWRRTFRRSSGSGAHIQPSG